MTFAVMDPDVTGAALSAFTGATCLVAAAKLHGGAAGEGTLVGTAIGQVATYWLLATAAALLSSTLLGVPLGAITAVCALGYTAGVAALGPLVAAMGGGVIAGVVCCVLPMVSLALTMRSLHAQQAGIAVGAVLAACHGVFAGLLAYGYR